MVRDCKDAQRSTRSVGISPTSSKLIKLFQGAREELPEAVSKMQTATLVEAETDSTAGGTGVAKRIVECLFRPCAAVVGASPRPHFDDSDVGIMPKSWFAGCSVSQAEVTQPGDICDVLPVNSSYPPGIHNFGKNCRDDGSMNSRILQTDILATDIEAGASSLHNAAASMRDGWKHLCRADCHGNRRRIRYRGRSDEF
ncbi:hypothetical protein QAD02_021156 [Eretmocerus hayati]|uniref:Uncharacterized protein n=1 Tax=Eretmocerus hayati TaxID=131215 RepID=A0ACC2PQS0_9HYME|nr:hypothetical protein QAD02_021156 [Eretmocerus hayati]